MARGRPFPPPEGATMNESSSGTSLKKIFDTYETFERNFLTLFTLGVGLIILYEIIIRNLGMQGLKWID